MLHTLHIYRYRRYREIELELPRYIRYTFTVTDVTERARSRLPCREGSGWELTMMPIERYV